MEKHEVTIFEDWVWLGLNHGVWILKNLADFVPALNNKQWKVRLSLQISEKTEVGDGEENIEMNAREYNSNYRVRTTAITNFSSGLKDEIESYTDADASIEIKFFYEGTEDVKRKVKVVLENSLD